MDLENWFLPQTVEEGKKYCKYFTPSMLDTKKKFHKNFDIENQFLFANLPRSGSNLMKAVIEDVTGFYMSDPVSQSPFGEYLQKRGVCVSSREHCQIIKTHYPFWEYIIQQSVDIVCKKVIILTRDPVTFADSYFHFFSTVSHDDKIEGDYFKHPRYKNFIKLCAKEYAQFHDYWFNESSVLKYWVRFEDYCEKPKETLVNIFKFLEGCNDLRPEIMDRINDIEANNRFFKSPYRVLKKYSGKIDIFKEQSEEIIKYIYKTNISVLKKLNYIKYLKSKASCLRNEDDVVDDDKWLINANAKNMEMSIKTKVENIPNFILPKPRLHLSHVTVCLNILDTLYIGKNKWKKILAILQEYRLLWLFPLSVLYYQARFYYKFYIFLTLLLVFTYFYHLK